MTEPAHRLGELARRLTGAVSAGAQVRLLPEDQLLVARDMVRNRPILRRAKTETYVPARTGYRVYVACRSAEEHASLAATSQRVLGPYDQPVAWDGGSMRLRVDETTLDREWRLLTRGGQVVVVHARCGSQRVVGEVNAILAEVEEVLLA